MKRLAERGSLRPPRRGYVAPCAVCGLEVLHAHTTKQPTAQHLRSKAHLEASSALAEAIRDHDQVDEVVVAALAPSDERALMTALEQLANRWRHRLDTMSMGVGTREATRVCLAELRNLITDHGGSGSAGSHRGASAG